jgi:hypothetical protein
MAKLQRRGTNTRDPDTNGDDAPGEKITPIRTDTLSDPGGGELQK